MPSILLKRDFVAGNYYHIKHTTKKDTTLFKFEADYKTFILLLSYYLRFPDATPLSWVKRLNPKTVVDKRNNSELGASPVTLHGFLLLPDRFHLLLKENAGKKLSTLNNNNNPHPASGGAGVSNLMRRLSVGYAMYYNKTYNVKGTIYQGKYKNYALTQDQLKLALDQLHNPEGVNDTYLNQPLHSSRSDYNNTPRPWLTPLPQA